MDVLASYWMCCPNIFGKLLVSLHSSKKYSRPELNSYLAFSNIGFK